MVDGQAGKGDKYRPIDPVKWDEGWEKAFGKKKTKTKKLVSTKKSTSKGIKNV
jgi:hypothetical protein